MGGCPICCYDLDPSERSALDDLIADCLRSGADPAAAAFHNDSVWSVLPRVPDGVRQVLEDFRLRESAAGWMLRGFPVEDREFGPTPGHWSQAAASSRTRRAELVVALIAACLGDTFNWGTLQGGRLIQHILPIQGEEEAQSGHGSVYLEFHNEDAFHPNRCQYLLLFGVRNPDRVPTIVASMRDASLDPEARAILFQPRFEIRPDPEHLRQLEEADPTSQALARMRRMAEHPEPVAVLFGAPGDPYVRMDPPFMRAVEDDAAAAKALEALVAELERVQQDVVVEQGSILIVDNYRAVHGRRAFRPRYDGTDRWLLRALVTPDLRASRAWRPFAEARVLA
jgi:L-asparagine oxygenase